jgi:hypothetical protein
MQRLARLHSITVLWIATVVSNVGVWMQNAAADWLMTTLDPDPFLVSMVQFAADRRHRRPPSA